ncbi:hypothetical protein [Streptomyces sp. NPDC048603]
MVNSCGLAGWAGAEFFLERPPAPWAADPRRRAGRRAAGMELELVI